MKTNYELKNRIKAALASIDALAECLPEVHTIVSDGTVTLSGKVDTVEHKKLITETVNRLEGVTELIDDLKIQPLDKHRLDVDIDWKKGDMTLN